MAGPVASILLEAIPSDEILTEIENLLLKISDRVEGDDFWVASTISIDGTVEVRYGRPFGIVKQEINCEYSDEEIFKIQKITGFQPKFDLLIYAMCNDLTDHRVLGELILHLADKYDGLIDFKGQLANNPKNINGKLWNIPYATWSGETAIYNVADVDYLRDWLKCEDFRMVK